jgi:hypothetical protein
VFSDGGDTIVAGITGTGNLCVINRVGRHPDVGCVAIFADFRRLDVGRIFAGRVGTVVAACTITSNVHVIEVRWQPAYSGVTVVTVVAAVYVVRMLASRDQAIMAGATSTHYLRVVDGESGVPHIRRVAVFTDVTCLNMRGWFAGRFYAVMAAYAVPGDIHVVKIRWQPGDRGMTVVACVAAVDVGRMLARCGEPVMAGAAGTQDLSMVDGISR